MCFCSSEIFSHQALELNQKGLRRCVRKGLRERFFPKCARTTLRSGRLVRSICYSGPLGYQNVKFGPLGPPGAEREPLTRTTYSIHFPRCLWTVRQKGPIAPKWTYTPRHGPLGQRPEFRVRICLDRPKKDPLDHEPPVKFPLNKLQVGR